MASSPSDDPATIIVDDDDPALVYIGNWIRFVKSAPSISVVTDIFTVERELRLSSATRLMALV